MEKEGNKDEKKQELYRRDGTRMEKGRKTCYVDTWGQRGGEMRRKSRRIEELRSMGDRRG